jgi:hypothetical protein
MHRSDLGWTRQWNEADGVATTAKASSAVTKSVIVMASALRR